MKPLTPEMVIAVASAFVGLREQGGNNRGLLIEMFLGGVKQLPGKPWCAAFVHHVGYWSHFDHAAGRSSWPLPPTASCYVLGEFALRRGVLLKEPMPGDVFLQYNSILRRFAHTGIVARVVAERLTAGEKWYECQTIEGNTNGDGARDGDGVFCKPRRLYPALGDRFVRWVELGQDQPAGRVA